MGRRWRRNDGRLLNWALNTGHWTNRVVRDDPDWPEGQQPNVIGRARFGRIAIANSDSGAMAYTDSAIDQAYRAVQDLFQA